MNQTRFLTREEASLIQEAAEQWLRMRDVELNPGEDAAALLSVAHLRTEDCARGDIASLGRTLLLAVPGEPEAIPITLVRPGEEDLWAGHVSMLSDLGLACIGKVQGSTVRVPHGVARLVGFCDGKRAPRGAQEANHARA